jgi:hypothetical protein
VVLYVSIERVAIRCGRAHSNGAACILNLKSELQGLGDSLIVGHEPVERQHDPAT